MDQVAENYKRFTTERLSSLIVQPPYEPKDKLVQWVRGYIRYNNGDSYGPRDFVITGPRLRVVYGGCRWNRLVFALPTSVYTTDDQESFEFRQWVEKLGATIKAKVWNDPSKYRAGATSSNRFTFDDSFIKKSSDPSLYPDEMSTRISTCRLTSEVTPGEPNDVVDAEILEEGPNGLRPMEDYTNITAGSYITPILRVSYNRFNDRFGIVFTVIKAKYEHVDNPNKTTRSNSSWQFDDPMEQ